MKHIIVIDTGGKGIRLEVEAANREAAEKKISTTLQRLLKEANVDREPTERTLIVRAKKYGDDHIYEFRYPEKDPENGHSWGVPVSINALCHVRVPPKQFWGKGQVPFKIQERDDRARANQTSYPVTFEVFDFEWVGGENENS